MVALFVFTRTRIHARTNVTYIKNKFINSLGSLASPLVSKKKI